MVDRNEIQERSQARQHIKAEWNKLYLLDRRDKTPAVRSRMVLLHAKFVSLL